MIGWLMILFGFAVIGLGIRGVFTAARMKLLEPKNVSRGIGQWDLELAPDGAIIVRGPRPFPITLKVPLEGHPANCVELGDPAFDARFNAAGDPLAVFAVLTQSTRRALFASRVVTICDRELVVRGARANALAAGAEWLAALAERIDIDEEAFPARLLEGFMYEKVREVRRRQLALLLGITREPTIIGDAIAHALASDDPELWLMAAPHLDAPKSVLIGVASNPRVHDRMRARAVELLPRDALDTPALIALNTDAPLEMRAAIARRFRDEAQLLIALDDDAEEVQIAAARALAEVGTVAAVDALRRAGGRVMKSIMLRVATDAAIRTIQMRSDGERGGLSIAGEDDRGALSVSADRGALSLDSES